MPRAAQVSDLVGTGGASPTYSVVIPCYKSSRTIGELIARLGDVFGQMAASYEIVAVDDASPDAETWPAILDAAKQRPVRAFQLTRNFGRTAAVLCGMQRARGRWIVVMDDDLQHEPEEIPKLAAMRAHDVVVADFPFDERHHTLSQRLTSRLRSWFDFKILGKPRHIRMSPFIMIKGDIARMMLASNHQHPYMPAILLHVTRDIVAVHVAHAPRKDGQSNFGFVKRLKLFSNLVFNNSSLLLRAVATAGAGFAGLAVLVAFYLIVLRAFSTRYVPGWTSIAVIQLFIGGAILLALGIIGEYLIRIIQLGEQRPTYFVRAHYESGDGTADSRVVRDNEPAQLK